MDAKTLFSTLRMELPEGTQVCVEKPTAYEDELHNGCVEAVRHFEANMDIRDCLGDAKVLRYDEQNGVLVCQDTDETGTYNVEVPFDKYSIQDYVAKYLRVGRRIGFYIVDVRYDEEGKPIYIGDRRTLQQNLMQEVLSTYKVRDSIILAKITKVTSTSIFLDLGYGLATCLSVVTANVIGDSFVARVSYKAGDMVAVVLLEPIREDNTLVVSQRELLGTWADNAATICEGAVMCGVASSVCEFGTFVALTENIFGLTEPTTTVVPGQYVSVSINRIIPDKHKIKLGLVSDNSTCNGGECVSKRTQYYIKSYCENVAKNKDRWRYYMENNDRFDTKFTFTQRSTKYPRTYRASVAVCNSMDAQYGE